MHPSAPIRGCPADADAAADPAGLVELAVGAADEQPASSAPASTAAPMAARLHTRPGDGLDRADWITAGSSTGPLTGRVRSQRAGRGAPDRTRPSLAVPNAADRWPAHRRQVFGLSGLHRPPVGAVPVVPTGHRFPGSSAASQARPTERPVLDPVRDGVMAVV